MPATSAKLTYTLENRSTSPVTVQLDQLDSAIFGLEVFGPGGQRKFTIPPGVPPLDYRPRTETLQPGQRRRFELDLNVFSPPLGNGVYTATLRSDLIDIESDTARFTIEN